MTTRMLPPDTHKFLPGLLTLLFAFFGSIALAQNEPAAKAAPDKTPGQFFVVQEPITEQSVRRLETATQAYVRKEVEAGRAPVLVFEFRSRSSADQPASRFGAVLELCQLLSRRLGGARLVVGYVPEPLTGYAAMAPLACREVIFGTSATLGPIMPANNDAQVNTTVARKVVAELAKSLGRSEDLYEGLVDDRTDLLEVTTGDNQKQYVLKEHFDAFAKNRAIAHQQPAWPAGAKRVLDATRARGVLSRLSVDDRMEILPVYRLPDEALRPDPTLGVGSKGLWIKLDGNLDNFKLNYIKRKLGQTQNTDLNMVVLEMDTRGDNAEVATAMAELLESLKEIRTVAYVTGKAEGMAILPLLACEMIFVQQGAKVGDTYLQMLPDGKNKPEPPLPATIKAVSAKAEALAKAHGYSVGLARGLCTPDSTIVEAQDLNSGGLVPVDQADVLSDPKRFRAGKILKPAGDTWLIDATSVVSLGLGVKEDSTESLKTRLGLDDENLEIVGPSWVDYLIAVLNNRLMTFLILTLGLFLLVLEFKLPGVGLPAIGSAICFTLFFWSHYLSGTADQLEILLFAIGLICLAIELFVLPGFGIFGLAGVLLCITSIVLASHTFLWPSGASEYKEMGQTLIQLLTALAAVVAGIVWVGRNMHRVPLLKGLVLKPADVPLFGLEPEKKIMGDTELNLSHLIGQTGLTTTPLRPTGKARFGEMIVDATAETGSLEGSQPVEVVATRGLRVIVRQIQSPGTHQMQRADERFIFNEDLFNS